MGRHHPEIHSGILKIFVLLIKSTNSAQRSKFFHFFMIMIFFNICKTGKETMINSGPVENETNEEKVMQLKVDHSFVFCVKTKFDFSLNGN